MFHLTPFLNAVDIFSNVIQRISIHPMNMLPCHSGMNRRKEIRYKICFLQLLVRLVRNKQFSLCKFYGEGLEG